MPWATPTSPTWSPKRSAQAADDLRDPAWSAVAAFSRVHALLPMGDHNQTHTLAARATDAARSVTGEVNGNPALASYDPIEREQGPAATGRDRTRTLATAWRVGGGGLPEPVS